MSKTPPTVTCWTRADGSECMALVEWAKNASTCYRGPTIEAVQETATAHIREEFDRIQAADDAKKARAIARINKKFEDAKA